VSDAAVVGVEREGLTITRAYVVAASGATAGGSLAEELKEHVRRTLSPHKYPREVVFLDRIPRTGSGKVDRTAIRALSQDSA
jgi:benzoate-CoA ligase